MSLPELAPAEAPAVPDGPPRRRELLAAVDGAAGAVFAAVSALLLTAGIALVLWAVTPSTGSRATALLRGGVTAFCAGNGMTVTIGHAALTLPPLMITVVIVALLSGIGGRSRSEAVSRTEETARAVAAAGTYAVVVPAVGVLLGTPGAIAAEQWWRPGLLALLVVGAATLVRGNGWRLEVLARVPSWMLVSVRLAGVGVATVLGGGGVALVVGVARSFSDATTVQTLAAPGAAGGFGMALLSLAFLPNAVVAGAGYSVGVGFTVGGGTYSPLGSSPAELPAVSLLTAVPDGSTMAKAALSLLAFPVLAAVLIGRGTVRRLAVRNERVLAVGGAALLAAAVLAGLAAAASGGVTGGRWSICGVPPAMFGAVVALVLGGIGAGVAATARVPVAAAVPPAKLGDSAQSPPAVPDPTADPARNDNDDGAVPEPPPLFAAAADRDPAVDRDPAANERTTRDAAAPEGLTAEVANPDVASPDLASQDVASPDGASPDAANPEVANPEVGAPEVASGGATTTEPTIAVVRPSENTDAQSAG